MVNKQHIQLMTICLLTALTVSPVMAEAVIDNNETQPESFSDERLTGAGSGFVVGALVGGPLGAFIGTVAGDHLAKHKQETQQLNDDLVIAKAAIARYQQQIATLKAQQYQVQTVNLKVNEQPASAQLLSGYSTTLQFRTDSSAIEYHYQPALAHLLSLMQQQPELIMHVEGYADTRGQTAYNKQLSQQRTQQVADFMLRGGINSKRLVLNAYGEDKRLHIPESTETHPFERRVVITLQHPQQQI